MAETTWVKLSGSPVRIQRAFKDINGRAKKLVRDSRTQIFIEVPDSEVGWADKVAKDMGLSATSIPLPPKYDSAPCGVLTTNVDRHKLHCKTCFPLTHGGRMWKDRGLSTAAKNNKAARVMVRAVVPGLQKMDTPSLLAVMKQRLEECMTIAQNYESAIKAVEGIADSDRRLVQVQQEQAEHKKALALFLNG